MYKIAATYIGTVVGAGFASGQEILQFFAVFGNRGIIGLILVTVLFMIFGFIIMELGYRLKSESHLKIIKYSGGKYIGTLMDYIITFFLFGALTAMLAGSGAMLAQQFGISGVWGNLIMAVATAATVLTGIGGVVNSISFIVPVLLASALGVSIGSVFIKPPSVEGMQIAAAAGGLMRNWLWAAILYTSYNIILAIAVLGPLGSGAASRKAIRGGAVIGGLGLGISAAAIYFALMGNLKALDSIEIPMAFIAGQISRTAQIAYALVLMLEIYTTAVGSLYGFAARIAGADGRHAALCVLGTTLLAFAASRLGFSNLIRYVYPVAGYAGLTILVSLLHVKLKGRFAVLGR